MSGQKNCHECSDQSGLFTKNVYNSNSSALVDNDDDYSIISWIQLNDFNCTSIVDSTGNYDYYFWDIVPEWLVKHPLRNRTVCRKCHHECIGCFSNGYRLNENCKECRNFYSNSTNQCVNQCSKNEYLIQSSKVNILIIKYIIYSSYFEPSKSFFVSLRHVIHATMNAAEVVLERTFTIVKIVGHSN